jgi:hypothetical protein
MKVLAGLITQGTGSLGGMTMSKNKQGYYLRARTVPSNPRTALQTAVRSGLSAFATYWKSLTSTERTAWALYASNTPVVGNNGQTHLLSGFNWFVGCNQVRLKSGLGLVSDAPSIFGQASGPTVAGVVYASAGHISGAYTLIDPPLAADSGDVVQLYAGQPRGKGVAYFQGPWQYMLSIDSFVDSFGSTLVSTYTTYIAGASNVQWFKMIRTKPNGQFSAPYYIGPVAGM